LPSFFIQFIFLNFIKPLKKIPNLKIMKYKRVLLKLSGEALMGNLQYGIDPAILDQYSNDVKKVVDAGVEVAIVIGGGNIFKVLQAD
jgi:uridylate kinase